MRSIIVASNSSGGGKTTIAVGLMRALIKMGYEVQGYKVGPDYIDPAFHGVITKKPSRNLDLFLMGKQGVLEAYSRGQCTLGVVEGVMGLYDGKGIDSQYSTAHVAKVLNLPVILVLSPKAQSATLAAELQGMINYCDEHVKDSQIKGVILNNISGAYYKLLKTIIEKSTSLKVYGYIPKDEALALESRHLGLVQASEIEDLEKKIELCSEYIRENVDMEALIKDFSKESNEGTRGTEQNCEQSFINSSSNFFNHGSSLECKVNDNKDKFTMDNHNLKIGVAMDKAFSFYYKENLELLAQTGEIVYFSPLKDKEIPEDLDFLYIGGGYPEVFVEDLSKNKSMINSIKKALEEGLPCYAECGGLMYLTEGIIPFDKDSKYDTVGFFKGHSYLTKTLQNFGYAKIKVEKENPLIKLGTSIHCHEFHKSKVKIEEKEVYTLEKTTYTNEVKQWNCGYVKKNTLGAYGHVHFFNNIDFLQQLINKAIEYKKKK